MVKEILDRKIKGLRDLAEGLQSPHGWSTEWIDWLTRAATLIEATTKSAVEGIEGLAEQEYLATVRLRAMKLMEHKKMTSDEAVALVENTILEATLMIDR